MGANLYDLARHGQTPRPHGIGGSDVGALLGISPFRDRFDLWREKSGDPTWQPKPITPPMRWGTLLEPALRQAYIEDTGRIVTKEDSTIWHPNGIQYAHLDGVIQDEGIWEGKVPFNTWRDWFAGVPVYVQSQVQQYLAITGEPYADVSALLPGADFQTWRVESDLEAQIEIEAQVLAFWEQAQANQPPEARTQDEIDAQLFYRYPTNARPEMVEAESGDNTWAFMLASVLDRQRVLNSQEIELKSKLKDRIGEASGIEGAFIGRLPGTEHRWRATWRQNKDSVKTDWRAIATELQTSIDAAIEAFTTGDPDDARRFLTARPPGATLAAHQRPEPGARPFLFRVLDQEDVL